MVSDAKSVVDKECHKLDEAILEVNFYDEGGISEENMERNNPPVHSENDYPRARIANTNVNEELGRTDAVYQNWNPVQQQRFENTRIPEQKFEVKISIEEEKFKRILNETNLFNILKKKLLDINAKVRWQSKEKCALITPKNPETNTVNSEEWKDEVKYQFRKFMEEFEKNNKSMLEKAAISGASNKALYPNDELDEMKQNSAARYDEEKRGQQQELTDDRISQFSKDENFPEDPHRNTWRKQMS